MSLFEPNWRQFWEAKSQGIDQMLQRLAVLQFILYIPVKGGGRRGYMKSTGDRWGEGESKVGKNLWDWVKSKRSRKVCFFTEVGTG